METAPSDSETFSDNNELLLSAVLESGWEINGYGTDCQTTNTETCYPEMLPLRRRGEILLTYLSKSGMKYKSVPKSMQIEEVAKWLNNGSKLTIPISKHIHPRSFMAKNNSNFRKQALSEVFGDRLDPEKVGITFFLGPIEGNMSFKMSICNLQLLEKATREAIARDCEIIKYVS